jgi:hypothetical protein
MTIAMKVYRARKSTIRFTLGFLFVLTVLSVFGLFFAEPRWFFVAVLLALTWEWHRHLKAPVEIRVEESGSIGFRSLLGRVVLSPQQIKRVKRAGRYCSLEYDRGSINLYANMEGIQEFLSILQAANPALEVTTFKWGRKS